ncbi:MAG: hypothetical protein A3J55_04145 [Candidatus Ryanbacteria bacterium RIFCSPHIGHO2_02_FULL_45_17b]|nr:MAG: hypothetical protein A3J55_04145 [Candidatus Ryanbacteria bacterium RIFCSPHIGHO2_02_FULL_45_17b]
MKLTLGEIAVVCDALHARLCFGEKVGAPYRFDRENYERVLQKIYDSGIVVEFEIFPKEKKGEGEK